MSRIGLSAQKTQADKTQAQHPADRTFEAGLEWLCTYVTTKANAMYPSTDAIDTDEDEDDDVSQHRQQVQNVVAVCAQWRAQPNAME